MPIDFKRNLSPVIQKIFDDAKVLNNRTFNTHVAIRVRLRSGTILRYASGSITIDSVSRDGVSVAITPEAFTARLSGAPDIQYNSGRAPDGGEFKVVNLDYIITSIVPDLARIFDDAKVDVLIAFKKPSGNYEAIEYFSGLLRDVGGDDEEASLNVIHELASRASTVGREITQKCLNTFTDAWCGVNPATVPVGGDCTLVWADEVSGCAYWGGVFNGVPFLGNSAFGGYTGSTGGTPFPDDPPLPPRDCPCAETTWFESANGGYIHAKDIKEGENIYAPNNEIVTVSNAEIIETPYRYKVETNVGASIIASATHKILQSLDDSHGKALASWNFKTGSILTQVGSSIRIVESVENPRIKTASYTFRALGSGKVLRLEVSGSRRYWAGIAKGYMIGNHNLKDDFPIIVV